LQPSGCRIIHAVNDTLKIVAFNIYYNLNVCYQSAGLAMFATSQEIVIVLVDVQGSVDSPK